MEEYLENMRCLRSQMNDLEEEAANTSLEAERLRTAIQSVEKDLESVAVETKRFKDETSEILKVTGEICSQILEKQKQIIPLEIELSTFNQTLEFLRRERVSLVEQLRERSAYYAKICAELNAKLLEQQEWLTSWKSEQFPTQEMDVVEEGKVQVVRYHDSASVERGRELDSVTAKLEDIKEKKSQLTLEIGKSKQQLELLSRRIEGFPPELKEMDTKLLEEEHQALLNDKTGEMEFLQSLQDRIEQLQGISEEVKCQCGMEYKVEFGCDNFMLLGAVPNPKWSE